MFHMGCPQARFCGPPRACEPWMLAVDQHPAASLHTVGDLVGALKVPRGSLPLSQVP